MQNQSVEKKNMEEANLVNRYGRTTMWSPQSSSPLLLPSSSVELSSPSDGTALSSTRLPASPGPSTVDARIRGLGNPMQAPPICESRLQSEVNHECIVGEG